MHLLRGIEPPFYSEKIFLEKLLQIIEILGYQANRDKFSYSHRKDLQNNCRIKCKNKKYRVIIRWNIAHDLNEDEYINKKLQRRHFNLRYMRYVQTGPPRWWKL